MATFITRSDPSGPGVRVAVKDLVDMVGLPTTAGSRAVAATAPPAARDARCLQGLRSAEASGVVCFVGKTNLHELAFGVTGINPWFGTPRNPLDRRRVPGGSSSGSAVAVADGEADLALGTDTGGSIRIPAACCGIVGLKPTWGRIDLEGVWPLAPTLDTVGPMARGVAGVAEGLAWLAPEAVSPDRSPLSSPPRIGRIRLPARPEIDTAVDRALLAAGMSCTDVDLPHWQDAEHATRVVMGHEASGLHGHLVGTGLLGADVADRLAEGLTRTPAECAAAASTRARWRRQLDRLLASFDLLALPTLADLPPDLDQATELFRIRYTAPVNLSGHPALVLPVATTLGFPASLQLVGPWDGEGLLIDAALLIEAAAAGVP